MLWYFGVVVRQAKLGTERLSRRASRSNREDNEIEGCVAAWARDTCSQINGDRFGSKKARD